MTTSIQEFCPVDRPVKDGEIQDVLVCGFESKNGRRYSKTVLESALPMYEGVPVFCNHLSNGERSRKAEDRLGDLHELYIGNDGLRAHSFKFMPSHPMASRIRENPERFGFSHDVDGEIKDGIVEGIGRVNSVDLVAVPATTKNLKEEEEPITATAVEERTIEQRILHMEEMFEKILTLTTEKVEKTEDCAKEELTQLRTEVKNIQEQMTNLGKREFKYLRPKVVESNTSVSTPLTEEQIVQLWKRY